MWAYEVDVRRTSRAIVEMFDRYGLPDEAVDDLIAIMRPARAQTPGRLPSL